MQKEKKKKSESNLVPSPIILAHEFLIWADLCYQALIALGSGLNWEPEGEGRVLHNDSRERFHSSLSGRQ